MAFSAPAPQGSTKRPPHASPPAANPTTAPDTPSSTEENYIASAVSAMHTLRANECPLASRAGLIGQLLRDISLQRIHGEGKKTILKGLAESIRSGYVPNESVNVIANVALGEIQTWPEADRSMVLRDFLVAIADAGHSDLLRSAITVSTIRLLEGFPDPSVETRSELSLWLGYALVRNRIPQQLRDGVVRVCFAALRNPDITTEIRGKIAWVVSTLVDVTEFPYLPIEEILQFGEAPEVPEKLREQTKSNLNRRALMSVGYF